MISVTVVPVAIGHYCNMATIRRDEILKQMQLVLADSRKLLQEHKKLVAEYQRLKEELARVKGKKSSK